MCRMFTTTDRIRTPEFLNLNVIADLTPTQSVAMRLPGDRQRIALGAVSPALWLALSGVVLVTLSPCAAQGRGASNRPDARCGPGRDGRAQFVAGKAWTDQEPC